jgi:hypothetical protein
MIHAMPIAAETDQIAPGVFIWQFYDPAVKADLFSTALETPSGMWLIDPIALNPDLLRSFESRQKIAGIVITNENHERAAARFGEKFPIPICFHETLRGVIALPRAVELQDQGIFAPGLAAIAIDGGPAGEIAVHCNADGGTLVLGDALINLEPYGFALLPEKYCSDFKLMRRSLFKLLEHSFKRMLFAHGTPIVSGARARLEQLLAEAG